MGIYVDTVTIGETFGTTGLNGTVLNGSAFGDIDTDYTITLPVLPLNSIRLTFDFDASVTNPLSGTESFQEEIDITTSGASNGEVVIFDVPGLGTVSTIPSNNAPSTGPDEFVVFVSTASPVSGTEFSIEVSGLGTPTETDTLTFIVGSSPTDFSITPCFAPGTGIATPDGERPVERLRPGDPVLTADGRTVPVKWLWRTTRNTLFAPEDRLRPVRVAAGALGRGMPHSDLILTADHALIIDGLAINAGALVNGTTITLEPIAALDYSVTYFHVETEDHDVILANGAPAETFIDYMSRRTFDNYAGFAASCDAADVVREMDMPRISAARLVPPEIRARLARRAAA